MKKIILLFIALATLISIVIALNKIYAWELPLLGVSIVSGIIFFYIAAKSKKEDDAK